MGGHERATVFVIYVQNVPTRAVGDTEEEMKLTTVSQKSIFVNSKAQRT